MKGLAPAVRCRRVGKRGLAAGRALLCRSGIASKTLSGSDDPGTASTARCRRLLPPGPVGARAGDLLLGTGAADDGGRHAHQAGRSRCARVVATVLLPIERLLMIRWTAWRHGGDYLGGLQARHARAGGALRTRPSRRSARRAHRAARPGERDACALLELRPALTVRAVAADVLYEASDPYSRKVVIDRGSTGGVVLGAPVINEQGVLRPGHALVPAHAPR